MFADERATDFCFWRNGARNHGKWSKPQTRQIVGLNLKNPPSDNLMWHCPTETGRSAVGSWDIQRTSRQIWFCILPRRLFCLWLYKKKNINSKITRRNFGLEASIHMPRWASASRPKSQTWESSRMQTSDREFWGEEKMESKTRGFGLVGLNGYDHRNQKEITLKPTSKLKKKRTLHLSFYYFQKMVRHRSMFVTKKRN